MICGKCKEDHPTAGEVRACYGASAPARAPINGANTGHKNVLSLAHLESGTYTVVLEDSSHVTLRVGTQKWVDDPNTRVIEYLSGSDNEVSYTGIGFSRFDGRVVYWKKYRTSHERIKHAIKVLSTSNIKEAHEAFLNLAEEFALRSGSCMRCNKKLSVPASLHRGLGPVCAEIEGIA